LDKRIKQSDQTTELDNQNEYQANKKMIQFRPRSRGVKKIGLFFREETSTVQPERSGGRLLVLGKMIRFLASGI
jgi:hypothetical protein